MSLGFEIPKERLKWRKGVKRRKMKVKKGWIIVRVGLEEEDEEKGRGGFQRYVIPISYLYHPIFKTLLEKAHEVYGYNANGPLKLPCSLDEFRRLRWRVDKEINNFHHHFHHHHLNHFPGALSFLSC